MPLRTFAALPEKLNQWQRYLQECHVTADSARVYTVATLPDASGDIRLAFVSNETGGYTLAFSDGISWRRVQDRAVVS